MEELLTGDKLGGLIRNSYENLMKGRLRFVNKH